jgi:hypothetical protein
MFNDNAQQYILIILQKITTGLDPKRTLRAFNNRLVNQRRNMLNKINHVKNIARFYDVAPKRPLLAQAV